MKEGYHKHEGVTKAHAITVMHIGSKAKKAHEMEVKKQFHPKTVDKRPEYVMAEGQTAIVVKFNLEQLNQMKSLLQESGAAEIGCSVKPV